MPLSGFLYKSFTAAGAGHIDLTLALGNAEIILAAGAFEKAEISALAKFIHVAAEEVLHLVPVAQENHIFSTSALIVTGKNSEDAEYEQHCRKRGNNNNTRKACDKVQQQSRDKYSI